MWTTHTLVSCSTNGLLQKVNFASVVWTVHCQLCVCCNIPFLSLKNLQLTAIFPVFPVLQTSEIGLLINNNSIIADVNNSRGRWH